MHCCVSTYELHEKLQNEYWEYYVNLHQFIQSTTSLVAITLKKGQRQEHVNLHTLQVKLDDVLHGVQYSVNSLLEIQNKITRFDRAYCTLDLALQDNVHPSSWLISPKMMQKCPLKNERSAWNVKTHQDIESELLDALDLDSKECDKRRPTKILQHIEDPHKKRYSVPTTCTESGDALVSRFTQFQRDLRRHLYVAWNLISGCAWLAIASVLIRYRVSMGKPDKAYLNDANSSKTEVLQLYSDVWDNLKEYLTMRSPLALARQLTMWRLVENPDGAKIKQQEDGMTHQIESFFSPLRGLNGIKEAANMDDLQGICDILLKIEELLRAIETYRQRYSRISTVVNQWAGSPQQNVTQSNAVTVQVLVKQRTADCVLLSPETTPLKPGYKRSQIILYCFQPIVSVWPSQNTTMYSTNIKKTCRPESSTETHVYRSLQSVYTLQTRYSSKPSKSAAHGHNLTEAKSDINVEKDAPTTDRFTHQNSVPNYSQVSISIQPKPTFTRKDQVIRDKLPSSTHTTEIKIHSNTRYEVNGDAQVGQSAQCQNGLEYSTKSQLRYRPQSAVLNTCEHNESWESSQLQESVTFECNNVLSPLNTSKHIANAVCQDIENMLLSFQEKLAVEPQEPELSDQVQQPLSMYDLVEAGSEPALRSSVIGDAETIEQSVLPYSSEDDLLANVDLEQTSLSTTEPEAEVSEHPSTTLPEEPAVTNPDLTQNANEIKRMKQETSELEETVAWVTTEVCKIRGFTSHNPKQIQLHLAIIDQATEALAPLGGQIRQLLRQINQIEPVPVCSVQLPVVQNQVKDNGEQTAADTKVLSKLRIRLKMVRQERSNKLHECEQLVIHLEQMKNLHEATSANLQSIQDELALCSRLLGDKDGMFHRINWDPAHGLEELLGRYDRILNDLNERVRLHLVELGKSTAEFQLHQLRECVTDVTTELEELFSVMCQKRDGLKKLNQHLTELYLRTQNQLTFLQNELVQMKRSNSEFSGTVSQEELATIAADLRTTFTHLHHLKSELHALLAQLFEVTQTVHPNPILVRCHVEGTLEGVNHFVQMKINLTDTWTQMMEEIEKQAQQLLHTVAEWVTTTCSRAVEFGATKQLQTMLCSGEYLSSRKIQALLDVADQHCIDLKTCSDWIKENIDSLVYDKPAMLLIGGHQIKKRDELLSQLDDTEMELQMFKDELQTIYSPAATAMNDRVQKALSYLKLLVLQFQQLPMTTSVLSVDSVIDEHDELISEMPIATQLELARVQQTQCQQLSEAVKNEFQCFSEDIAHIWESTKQEFKPVNTFTRPIQSIPEAAVESPGNGEVSELITLDEVMSGSHEMDVKHLLQAYHELDQQVSKRIAQFDQHIIGLVGKGSSLADEPEYLPSTDDTDVQIPYFEGSEADSGIPGELSSALIDPMTQFAMPEEVHESYDQLDLEEVEQELRDLIGEDGLDEVATLSPGTVQSSEDGENCSKPAVGAAGDTASNEPEYWCSDSTQLVSTRQRILTDEAQLSEAEAKLNNLRIHYRSTMQSMISNLNDLGSDSNPLSLIKLADKFRKTLPQLKKISGELCLLPQLSENVDAILGLSSDEALDPNVIQLTLYPKVIPLWYRRESVAIRSKTLTEAITECEKLVLCAYELAERIVGMTGRLEPWLEAQLNTLDAAFSHDLSTPDELRNVLNTVSTIKLMIRSKVHPIGQVIHDAHLLHQTVEEIQAKMRFEQQLNLLVANDHDRGRTFSMSGDVSHKLGKELLARVDYLNATYTNLVKKCETATKTICCRLFNLGRADLLLKDIEQTVVNVEGAQLVEEVDNEATVDSCTMIKAMDTDFQGLLAQIVHLKQLELNHSELNNYQSILSQIYVPTGAEDDIQSSNKNDLSLEPEWQRIHGSLGTALNTTSNSLFKRKITIAELQKLDSLMLNEAAWLRRNGLRLCNWAQPKGLSQENVSTKLQDLQEFRTNLEFTCRTRLSNTLEVIHESVKRSISNDHVLKKFVTCLEMIIQQESTSQYTMECLEELSIPGLKVFLHEQQRYNRLTSSIQNTWNAHAKFVSEHEHIVKKLLMIFQNTHATLDKLYRPSKLVKRCTEQLREVKDAICHLQSYAAAIDRLELSLPELRRLCDPAESSQVMANIRSMKHEFQCLNSRAEERNKILEQALREDTVFDKAYNQLMVTLRKYCEATNQLASTLVVTSPSSEAERFLPQSGWMLERESASYYTVLRLGGYLRDRCTESDPERGILNAMLAELRQLWRDCAHKQAELSFACEKSLLDRGCHSVACEKLREWIRLVESKLNISNSSVELKTDVNIETLTLDGVTLIPVKWRTGSTSSTVHLACIKKDDLLRECGFSASDLQSLVSIYGDTALVDAIQDEVRLFTQEMEKRLHLWAVNESVQDETKTKTSISSGLRSKLIRLQIAIRLRTRALESASDTATAIQQTWLVLSKWLSELEIRLKAACSHPIASSIYRSAGDSGSSQSQLDIYEYALFTRAHITAPMMSCYSTLIKKLIPVGELGRNAIEVQITGRCHSRAKSAIQRQYQTVVSKWHQMEQRLKVLRVMLKQDSRIPKCVWDLEELEQVIGKMAKDVRRELGRDQQLSKKLAGALLQPTSRRCSTSDIESLWEPVKLCQQLCDPFIQWNTANPLTIECYLNQCEIQLINATTMKSQVTAMKSRVSTVLKVYQQVVRLGGESNDSQSSIVDDLHTSTTLDSHVSVDEPDADSASWSQDSIKCDSGLVLPSSGWSGAETKLDPSLDTDDQTEMVALRQIRCRKLEVDFTELKRNTDRRVENIRAIRDALYERIKLDQFDFEAWRQSYLKWQAKRRFRVSDLFKAVAPDDISSTQRSNSSCLSTDNSMLSGDEEWTFESQNSSEDIPASPAPTQTPVSMGCIPSSPKKSVAFGSGKARLKDAASFEHLGVIDKHEPAMITELTCAQFVQGITRHRPNFKGSDALSLRAAFATIDTKRKGSITIKQLMDALQPERQRQDIPVSELIQIAIDAETKKCRCQTKFVPVKVDENRYRFGPSSQLYLVRFLNSITMVRVGGGWQNLTEFLATRDPCRARNKTPSLNSTVPSAMGTHQVSPAQAVTLSRTSPTSNLGSMRVTTTLSRTSSTDSGSSVSTTPAKSLFRTGATPNQAPKATQVMKVMKRVQGNTPKAATQSTHKNGSSNGRSC